MERQGRTTQRPPRGRGASSSANRRRPPASPTDSPLTGGMIVSPPAGAVHDEAPADPEAEATSQALAAAAEAQPRLDLHSSLPPPKKKKKRETSSIGEVDVPPPYAAPHLSESARPVAGRRAARAVAGGGLNSDQTSSAGSRASDLCGNPWHSTTTHSSLHKEGKAESSAPGRKSFAPPAIKGVERGGGGGDRHGRPPGSLTVPGSRTANDARRMSLRAPMLAGAGASEGGGSSNNTTSGAGFGRGRPAEDTKRWGIQDSVKAGNVEAMCPLKEQTTRLADSDVHMLEKDPSGQELRHGHCLVKRYQRSAAGVDIGQRDLVRTPLWLARTVDHLVVECMDKGAHGGGDPTLAFIDPRIQDFLATFRRKNPSRAHLAEQEAGLSIFDFVSNRLRMVKSEYRMQGYNSVDSVVSESCIVAHERMARWYVLMAIRMAENPLFVHRFNATAIVETLKLLCELYEILVSRGKVSEGLASPNEPEMMGLYLLAVSRQDGGLEMDRVVRRFFKGNEVLDSPEMKGVVGLLRAWQKTQYLTFFREVRRRSSMMQRCLLPPYVKDIRNGAMEMIAQAWSDMPVSELQRILGFTDEVEAVAFAKAYGVPVVDGNVLLRKKEGGKWINTFRQPSEIPEMLSTQEFVEPAPWLKASEVVSRGDEQSVADKAHCTAPLAEFSDSAQLVCHAMAAGGRVSDQRAWMSERTATARTDLSSSCSSSSASPAASVADRSLSAQLPAPRAIVDPPLSSNCRSAVPSSTVSAAGTSHGQCSQESTSAAALGTRVPPAPPLQPLLPSAATAARGTSRPSQGEAVDVSGRAPSPARAVGVATTTAVGQPVAESIVAGSVTASASTAATTSGHRLYVGFQRTDNAKTIDQFAKFFDKCFGNAIGVAIHQDGGVAEVSGKRQDAVAAVAGYMQHAIHVCREGPWQPTSFSLVQVRLPAHGEDGATSRFILPATTTHPRAKRLRALSNAYGIATVNLGALDVATAGVDVDYHPSSESGLPRLCVPPRAAVRSVAQLWGLHHAVESALDKLLCPGNQVRTPLCLGRRIVGQLVEMGWAQSTKAKVTLDEESGTVWVKQGCRQSVAAVTDALVTELPRSIQMVNMIDAAVMRNLAVPAALQALARMGGGTGASISILPVWLTSSVLVLAPGEDALGSAVGEVHHAVTRAVRLWTATRVRVPLYGSAVVRRLAFQAGHSKSRSAERHFFRQGFTDKLAKVVSDVGVVDMWLDCQCLRAQAEDAASKTRAEELLLRELTSKYPDLLVSGTTVADAPDPTSGTGAEAGPSSLPLSEDGAIGACASNAFSAPEAVVLARTPMYISNAAHGGGSRGDGWDNGVRAGSTLAQALAAAPATVHRSGLTPAVTTASASRRRGGKDAAFGQGGKSTRPTVGAAVTPAAVEVEVSTTPVTALGASKRGSGVSSAATATRRAGDAGDDGGDQDGYGAASSLSSIAGTASGPPASAVGTGGFRSVESARVPAPTSTGSSEALAPAGAGRHTLAPSSVAFPSGAAAASTADASAGHATGRGEATVAEYADSGRAAAAAVLSFATDASRPVALAAGSCRQVRQEIDTVAGPERAGKLAHAPRQSVGHGDRDSDEEEQGQRLMMSLAMMLPH